MILNIVLPVFAIIATGYFCGRREILGSESSKALNAFVYWVALPALLFGAMARVELSEVYNLPFIVGFTGATFFTWLIVSICGKYLFRLNSAEAALHGLNGAYPNSGYMGIPLAIAAFGDAATLPAIMAAVISVLSVSLAVIPIELSQQKHASLPAVLGRVLGALVRNPMIVAPCLGLLWAGTGLALPAAAVTYFDILGAAAGPCALFSIGLYLVGKPLREGGAELASMAVAKLALQPVLTAVALLLLFPTDPLWAKVAILLAALPIGSGPFVLAQAHGIYVRRTSTAMLLTTVLSFATISAYFAYLSGG